MSYDGPILALESGGIDPGVKRPIVRYFGGKFQCAPKIVAEFPDHSNYVEVFGGGGSILLRKKRSHSEIYNDLDKRMTNLFRVLREPDTAEELIARIYLTPFSREEFDMTTTDRWPTDPVENARWTILRSQLGFGANALNTNDSTAFRGCAFRNNSSPPVDFMRLPNHIPAIVERLRGVTIEERDFRKLIPQCDRPDTLFYLDPPYQVDTRGSRRKGRAYIHDFTDQDHRDMADAVKDLEGMVIISGYSCDLYDELFGDWRSMTFGTHADGGRDRVETLWFSPNIPPRQRDLFDE